MRELLGNEGIKDIAYVFATTSIGLYRQKRGANYRDQSVQKRESYRYCYKNRVLKE
jgi:hypothetical protein